MIEFFVFQKIAENKHEIIEPFSSDKDATTVAFVFSLVAGIFCVYLSWSCNTKNGVETPLKLMYAFFAWFFGIFYLIFYFVANYLGTGCNSSSKQKL